ncbi:MAG: substrate-binding domain-containing protein [Verrucomicrobiales bacterium]
MKRSGPNKRVALVLDNMELPFRCNMDVLAGCQKFAAEANWDCVINPFADRALGSHSGSRGFDGVIAHASPALAKAARSAGVPVVNVTVNTQEDSPVRKLPAVLPDCEAAGALAAEHLLARGFKHFGFLGFSRNTFSRQQWKGFCEVVKIEGFSCTDHRFGINSHIANAEGWESFIEKLESWIDTWALPIGLYVTEDLPCRYLIDVCQSKGLQVPQDVAIVGSHDDFVICTASTPTLTSIDHGYLEIGYRAATLLKRLMAGRPAPVKAQLVAPAELIPRQSTDSFGVEDQIVRKALRFIAEYAHQPIRVGDVAKAAATTRRTLERRFRDTMNRTIAEEIGRFRLERAKRHLVDSDTALKVVAQEAGFTDANHLYKAFVRIEGTSPTEYRSHHQREHPAG